MTVALLQDEPYFCGPSTDIKPLLLSAGSRFFETDTSQWYIFDGQVWRRLLLAGGSGYNSSATITRTNDTNGYTAMDVIGAATGSTAAIEFANIGPSGGRIMLTSLRLRIDLNAVTSGMGNFLLYLYNVTPPSAVGDNGAFDLPSGDRASYLGKIRIPTPIDEVATLSIDLDGINKQVQLASSSLFAYLVTEGAYTPAASTVHVITLHAVAL